MVLHGITATDMKKKTVWMPEMFKQSQELLWKDTFMYFFLISITIAMQIMINLLDWTRSYTNEQKRRWKKCSINLNSLGSKFNF
jgi:hypothetical protein